MKITGTTGRYLAFGTYRGVTFFARAATRAGAFHSALKMLDGIDRAGGVA